MTRNRTIGVVLVLVVIALISWAVYHNKHKNDNNSATPNLSVSVVDQSQNNADATTVTAHAKDNLVYTLNAENTTDKIITGYVIQVGIGDVTKVATLVDAQGANYDSSNNSLIWTPLDIPGHGSIQKQFTVRIKDTLPANSADRVAKVSYNNEVVTNLGDSSTAVRPGTTGSGISYNAPKTGIPGWVSFYLAAFITLGVFLFRVARKLGQDQA